MTLFANAANSDATKWIETVVPTSPTQLVNKAYVDLIAAGFTFHAACFASTTANLNASYSNGAGGVGATLTNAGAQTAFSTDGTSPALNARILVQFQTSAAQNGIYTLTTVGTGASNWVLTRATDYDQNTEIIPGSFAPVTMGTLYNNTFWVEINTITTVGTDPVAFNQFGASVISFPITASEGGTGVVSPTANTLPVAQGTSAFLFLGPLLNGQILIGSTAATPVANTISAGVGIGITNGAGSITVKNTLAIVWSDVGASGTVTSFSGSFSTASILLNLPASPANGDIVEFYNQFGSALQVQAVGTQIIQVNTAQSVAAGTATSYQIGDTLTLVYRSTNTCWCATAYTGNWLIQ